MHKQRLAVIIAAGLGLVSLFLPWASLSMFGVSYSVNGLQAGGPGYIMLVVFVVAGVFAFLGDDRTAPIDASKVKIVAGVAALGVLMMLYQLLAGIGFSYAGLGAYLAFIAALAVLAVPFVIKDSGAIEMPTADSIKDEFNEIKDN